jgi:hypothetical protein
MKLLLLSLVFTSCLHTPENYPIDGPDVNNNGIHDEVDVYIEENIKDIDKKNGFKQYAKYLRRSFEFVNDKDKSIQNTFLRLQAMGCISELYWVYDKTLEHLPSRIQSKRNREIRNKHDNMINGITYRTHEQLEIRGRISEHFSGQVTILKPKEETCEFELQGVYK